MCEGRDCCGPLILSVWVWDWDWVWVVEALARTMRLACCGTTMLGGLHRNGLQAVTWYPVRPIRNRRYCTSIQVHVNLIEAPPTSPGPGLHHVLLSSKVRILHRIWPCVVLVQGGEAHCVLLSWGEDGGIAL